MASFVLGGGLRMKPWDLVVVFARSMYSTSSLVNTRNAARWSPDFGTILPSHFSVPSLREILKRASPTVPSWSVGDHARCGATEQFCAFRSCTSEEKYCLHDAKPDDLNNLPPPQRHHLRVGRRDALAQLRPHRLHHRGAQRGA
mgnify:CR=1 FL=1